MKKREIVLIIILLVLMVGTGYYVTFYRPIMAQINQTASAITHKTDELDYAILRETQYALLSEQNEALFDEWAQMTASLPSLMDDADVLRRLQQIIYPHQRNITVTFPDGPTFPRNEDGQETKVTTGIYTVHVTFTVTYDALQSILKQLADEDMDNRVVNYEIELMEETETGKFFYHTTLKIDFLVDKGE